MRIDPDHMYKLLYVSQPHELEFYAAGSGTCQYLPLVVLLVELIGLCYNVVSPVTRCLLGRTLIQINVRCCLWPALGYLFGAIK